MPGNTTWDRAASIPGPRTRAVAPSSDPGRRTPELATLGEELPSVGELFTFMRDAEHRFESLLMRIEERAWTSRGEDVVTIDLALRHPGRAKVLTSRPDAAGAGDYDVWVSDGTTVRTYVASRKVGTRRPVRAMVRGVADGLDLPGRSRFYVPRTQLRMESLPELFVHPAGFCQNVLGTGSCRVTGTTEVAGRQAIVLECDHPRTVETVADRPDYGVRIAVDRRDGVILRLEESVGGRVTRDAGVTSYLPDQPIPPAALDFRFPPDTTFIY
jgi:outer membrane lipoprotein-sorting protein